GPGALRRPKPSPEVEWMWARRFRQEPWPSLSGRHYQGQITGGRAPRRFGRSEIFREIEPPPHESRSAGLSAMAGNGPGGIRRAGTTLARPRVERFGPGRKAA